MNPVEFLEIRGKRPESKPFFVSGKDKANTRYYTAEKLLPMPQEEQKHRLKRKNRYKNVYGKLAVQRFCICGFYCYNSFTFENHLKSGGGL